MNLRSPKALALLTALLISAVLTVSIGTMWLAGMVQMELWLLLARGDT